MFQTVSAIPVAIILCQFAQAGAPAGAEAEIRQILADLANNRFKPDSKELDRIYADEFTATNASGEVLDKAGVIAARTSGRLSFRSYVFDDIKIRIYGDVAVVTDSERIESDTASGRFRHLRVLLRRDGRWQLVATQMTRIVDK